MGNKSKFFYKYKTEARQEQDNTVICAICRDQTDCDFLTRCGHHFHESCLSQITDTSTCPYCQQRISLSRWREKLLHKTKNMNEDSKNEIYEILSNMTGVDTSTGEQVKKCNDIRFGKKILEELTKIGWNINSTEEGGLWLFELCCLSDDLYRLNLLFEFGLKLDDNPDLVDSALEIAEASESNLVMSRIKDYTANICDNETGDSPLHEAVDNNDFETVKNLIAKHVDVNARNIYGSTPLHHAAGEANLEIVSYLLENGALIDCKDLDGDPPIYEACRSDNDDSAAVVKKLLDSGANTEHLDSDKNTLFHIVLISKRFDIAEMLIGKYPDINHVNLYKESCLHLAASFASKSLLKKLIEAGADVNLKDYKGQTPLHKALLTNSVEVVEFLLQKGADANASNKKSEYPIHLALSRIPSLPYVKALVRHGADLTVKNEKGVSVVELALESRY